METKTEIADIRETKTEIRTKSPDIGRLGPSPFRTPTSKVKRSHWVVFLVVCFLLGLLVFATALHVIGTDTGKARAVNAPAAVETVPVRRQTLEDVIGGSGAVEQSRTVQLTTQLDAQILEVPVKEGDLVKKGDLLVRCDDRLIEATIRANRDYVEASKIKIRDQTRQVDRYTALQNKKMGTQVDLEKSEMALADAREALAKSTLSLRQAEINLEYVTMRSPIGGIVLERLVNPGEWTRPGQLVLKLGSLNTVLMAPKLTEEKMHSVELGLPAETSFPAFPGAVFQGKVFKIDPNIDPLTRTFTAYVEINNPDFRLKPGLSGFARIRRTAKNALVVPSIAVMDPSGEQPLVYVVNDSNRANLRKVRSGIVANGLTEITSGLKEGEKVVTVGQLNLKENDKVHTTSRSIFK
jgi:RND family efflux transporter MFP subunit